MKINLKQALSSWPYRIGRTFKVLSFLLIVVISWMLCAFITKSSKSTSPEEIYANSIRDLKVAMSNGSQRRECVRTFIDTNLSDAKSYLSLPPGRVLSVSMCLHLLRMFGSDLHVKIGDNSDLHVLDAFTEATLGLKVFGNPTVVKTPYGLRFPSGQNVHYRQANETHRDQCLATFGEIDLALNTPILIGIQKYTLFDVLHDSVANFHLKQAELEWSALAYANYLAPYTRTWANRFGESYTFDDIAVEILNRPYPKQSCGGLHCLMALTTLYKADSKYHFFAPSTRVQVAKELQRYIHIANEQQTQDGHWHPGWTIPFDEAPRRLGILLNRTESASLVDCVLVTGHTCEWLNRMPDEFTGRSGPIKRASKWLAFAVKRSTIDDRWNDFCPWSHAVSIVWPNTSPGGFSKEAVFASYISTSVGKRVSGDKK